MSAKHNWTLVGIAVVATLGFQGTSWCLTAHVNLMGDEEGWTEDNLSYMAETWPDLDEDEQQEIDDGQGHLVSDFDWDFDGGECTTPPADSMSECCKFSWAQGGQYHTISVTVTITIEWNDGTSTSDTDTDTLDVKVKRPELESVTSSNGSICAGHCSSGVHKSTIKATVTDGFGAPAPGWEVTFAITAEDHVETAASLSTTDPVETNYVGEASVVLTSSDKVCTVTVEASGEWGESDSVSVGVGLPSCEPDPDEVSVIALGGSKQLQETLTFDLPPVTAVPGHDIQWEITDVQVYDGDGDVIENPTADDYGSLDPETDTSDGEGKAETTYCSGSAAGYITIEATDTTCYDASNEHPKLDTFQIIVVRLDHLDVYDAYQVADTDTWAAGISDTEAYVTIAAQLVPWVSPEQVSEIISWQGGQAGDDCLQRKVSRQTCDTTEVTATVGTTSDSVTIVVCEVTYISVVSGAGSVTIDDDHHAVTAEDKDDTNGVILQACLSPSVSPVPEGLLCWMGGSSVADHPEQRKVSKNSARKEEVVCECGDSSADITVWVIKIDLGIAGVSDADEDETPGEVYINTDDDNDNDTQDKSESPVPGENDLISITLEIIPEDVPAGVVTITPSAGIAV